MSINFISQLSLLDIHSWKNCINLYGKFETDGNNRVEGIEKMKVAKLFSGIADILIAYCVGHCSLLGTAPFGTAIIGAAAPAGEVRGCCYSDCSAHFLSRVVLRNRDR